MDVDELFEALGKHGEAPRTRSQSSRDTTLSREASLIEYQRALADEDGVVYFLNKQQLNHLRDVIWFDEEHWAAECILAERAQRWSDLGIHLPSGGLGIRAPIYRPFGGFPSREFAQMQPELMTDPSTVIDHEYNSLRLDDLYAGARAAAGALLCHPAFIAECYLLRQTWKSLAPEFRPQLPLHAKHLTLHIQKPDEIPLSLSEFARQLTDFFQRWRLERMVTWDLPDPVSFHAPDRRDRPAEWPEDRQVVTISGLIPLKKGDHRIPDWMDRDNRSWRSEHGLGNIDRQSKQFQNIAMLRFFELAVEARLKATKTASLSKTARYAILGKLLNGKNEGHVRKILRFQKRLRNRPIVGM